MKKDILYIEDNDNLRKLMIDNLNDYKINCIGASNGVDGIKKYIEQYDSIGIVLTDINMVGWTGYDIKEHIRLFEFDKKIQTPIIATTGMTDFDLYYYLEQGFDDYLPKPSTIDTILETIYRHLKWT